MLSGSLAAAAGVAQTAGSPAGGINFPGNSQMFAQQDPFLVKATAIVNGDVITASDLDQRVALIVLANDGVQVPAEEMQRVRAQVLRDLIDETLKIQAAAAQDIKIEQREIDGYYAQFARSFNHTTASFGEYLRANGSSERAVKRQIHGDVAWNRLQQRQIEPFVSVGQEEVKSILDRMASSKGTREYRVGEIFLSATSETAAETRSNAARIIEQLKNGASFMAYARQFSEASTAAVGGDLGWIRPEQLPQELARAVQAMPEGTISEPIAVPGGYSIIALIEARNFMMPDPRDAQLSLKQLSITFPPGMSIAQMNARIEDLARVGNTMGGCGRAEQAAAEIGAEVVTNDQLRIRDLPPPLQEIMLNMNIGQATAPSGTAEDGVRMLVLCGRDDPVDAGAPSFDQVYTQLNNERVNRRAQRLLRDLRRDAVVDYR